MRLPNQPNPAPHKRFNRRVLAPVLGMLSMPLILAAGCSSGTPNTSSVSDFFSRLSHSESPTPTASPIPTATPTATPTPQAGETQGHTAKKPTRQAHVAAKPSGTPSNTGAEVSLEPNPGAPASGTLATPSARGSAASVAPAAGAAGQSSPSLESSGSADGDPAKAAKLIQDVDGIEKRVDRTNLSADDSQRDILAQKLLLEARESLAERDNVAAMSLATKASTLLAPLPKVADSASPPAP
jgi:hypothetical protein